MGDYSYTASEILFGVDYTAYKAEHAAFKYISLEAESEESQ